MPRFVILFHATPPDFPRPSHYDFMLEADGVMKTWALPVEPVPGVLQIAEQIHDHRLDYFEFEGEIAGNKGTARRWDRGDYATIRQSHDEWCVQLVGGALCSLVTLRRLSHDPQRWEFVVG